MALDITATVSKMVSTSGQNVLTLTPTTSDDSGISWELTPDGKVQITITNEDYLNTAHADDEFTITFTASET